MTSSTIVVSARERRLPLSGCAIVRVSRRTSVNRKRWIGAFAIFVVFTTVAAAQTLEPETLRRKQEDQQRARTMTRELLGNVLDLQLRQLEENGLEDLPVYRDIQLMRDNLQQVVDAEMTKVVELLAAAQRQPAGDREQSFVEARKLIRTVVVRLSAERQSLLRRLKAAELAEQARRLVQLQVNVQAVVKSIPEEARTRQETLALKAREDQQDVKGLFFPLLETLDDVRSWGGPMANVCQDALSILQAAEVGQHLDRAETELAAEHFAPTVEHQEGVLKGLRELLKLLDKTQGVLAGENRAAIERLHALAEKQEKLRDETRKLDPNEPPPRSVVEQQAAIQKELAELDRSVAITPTADRLLEQAEVAAKDATADLFDGQYQKAVSDQGQVLGNLAALEDMLSAGARGDDADQTAAELADLVESLKDVQDKLAQAEMQEDAAEKQAKTDNRAAAPLEQQAADTIAEAAKAAALPDAVKSQLEIAEKSARSAQDALTKTTGPATPEISETVDRAQTALDRAQATVASALHDAERRAAAVKIGELARAAEALERAAAEERDVAETAQSLPDDATSSAMADELAKRQATVADIAHKISEGLSKTAPDVSERTAQAARQVEQSQQQLVDAAKQPESASRHGTQAAKAARDAARQFAQAARQLRADVSQIAQALATQSGEQADALSAAREGIENAMNDEIGSLSDRIDRLQQAFNKTYEAAMDQQTASGRPEAAAAMKLARQLGRALDAQYEADVAADAAADNPTTPVKAVAQQQAVADTIEQARQAAQARAAAKANPTQDALSQSLAQARQQAQAAARQMLEGQTTAADANRAAALHSLAAAFEQSTAEASQAMQAQPSAAPDLTAQRTVPAVAEKAEQLAAQDAPSASRALGEGEKSAVEAAEALSAQQPQRAAPSQKKTEQSLASAMSELHRTLDNLQRSQAALLAQQANVASKLADEAARLDPDAMAALNAAAQAGNRAAEASNAALEQMLAKSAEKMLGQAAATVAAKEQQVRRDQAVAEALAAVTQQQQSAAELLDHLRELAEAAMNSEQPMPPDPQQAAQAAEDFAESQRATGQGAVELSGQQQVAEPSLRQALQMAAALPSARQAQTPTAKSQSSDAASAPRDAAKTDVPVGDPTDADQPGQPSQAAADTPLPPDTGFVPQTPDATAKLMAGPQLTKAMQAALDTMQNGAQQVAKDGQPASPNDSPQQASNTPPSQSNAASTTPTTSQQGVQPGQEQKNAALKDDLAASAADKIDPKQFASGSRTGDAEGALRRLQDEPWFAKLPPELRKSIGAGTQQKPPRAYEERLRRYFQSVD